MGAWCLALLGRLRLPVWLRTVLGVVLGLWLVSMFSGGFVLLVNRVLVGLLSAPLLVAGLMLVVVFAAGAAAVIVSSGFTGFLRGFLLAVGVALALLASLGPWAAVAYGLVLVAVYLGFGSARVVGWRRALLAAVVLAVVSLLLAFLALYASVASGARVGVYWLGEPVDVDGLRRFVPLMTAYTYASDRVQVPTHRVYPGDSYVYYVNGSSVYNWLIEPEGLWNRLRLRPLGAVLVRGDRYPPVVRLVMRPVAWGLRNMRLTPFYVDTLERRVVLASGLRLRPLLGDNMQVLVGGELVTLIPLEGWRRGLLWSLPVLAGYAVVHEDGRVEYVPAARLAGDPRFRGLPVYPEALARRLVELRRYAVGLAQFYLYHNTYVIRDVGTNPQPYLEPAGNGSLYWVFVAEPPGRTYSARFIVYVPAGAVEPGGLRFYRLPRPVIGVSRVSSYVKQAHPNYDWAQLSVEEPMPTVVGGRLYWKATVTTRDHRGLVSVELVDAETGEVASVPARGVLTPSRLRAVLSGNATAGQGGGGLGAVLERIDRLEKRVEDMMKQLEELKRELEELRTALVEMNTTRG